MNLKTQDTFPLFDLNNDVLFYLFGKFLYSYRGILSCVCKDFYDMFQRLMKSKMKKTAERKVDQAKLELSEQCLILEDFLKNKKQKIVDQQWSWKNRWMEDYSTWKDRLIQATRLGCVDLIDYLTRKEEKKQWMKFELFNTIFEKTAFVHKPSKYDEILRNFGKQRINAFINKPYITNSKFKDVVSESIYAYYDRSEFMFLVGPNNTELLSFVKNGDLRLFIDYLKDANSESLSGLIFNYTMFVNCVCIAILLDRYDFLEFFNFLIPKSCWCPDLITIAIHHKKEKILRWLFFGTPMYIFDPSKEEFITTWKYGLVLPEKQDPQKQTLFLFSRLYYEDIYSWNFWNQSLKHKSKLNKEKISSWGPQFNLDTISKRAHRPSQLQASLLIFYGMSDLFQQIKHNYFTEMTQPFMTSAIRINDLKLAKQLYEEGFLPDNMAVYHAVHKKSKEMILFLSEIPHTKEIFLMRACGLPIHAEKIQSETIFSPQNSDNHPSENKLVLKEDIDSFPNDPYHIQFVDWLASFCTFSTVSVELIFALRSHNLLLSDHLVTKYKQRLDLKFNDDFSDPLPFVVLQWIIKHLEAYYTNDELSTLDLFWNNAPTATDEKVIDLVFSFTKTWSQKKPTFLSGNSNNDAILDVSDLEREFGESSKTFIQWVEKHPDYFYTTKNSETIHSIYDPKKLIIWCGYENFETLVYLLEKMPVSEGVFKFLEYISNELQRKIVSIIDNRYITLEVTEPPSITEHVQQICDPFARKDIDLLFTYLQSIWYICESRFNFK